MSHKYFGAIDDAMQISKYFTLADLTVTSTGVDNTPTDADVSRLQQLGSVLDVLYDSIGPFSIVSAFRSPDVEAVLTERGDPTAEGAAGHVSFHSVGLGADIYPTSMNVEEYFGRMVAAIGTTDSPGTLHDVMSEVAYKPSQNSIHLAAAVDYRKNNVIMALNSVGKYAGLTAQEIMDFAQPYIQKAEQVISEAAATATAAVATPAGAGTLIALAAGAVILYMMTKKPALARA